MASFAMPIYGSRYIRLCANGCNNSQHGCASNVGSCCVRVGSGVQTDATTPNNVGTCSALWEGYNPFLQYLDEPTWNPVERIIKQVHLRDIVCSVIGSLDSPMTPSGCTLNVGQRQLVYLARAILKNNRIVVLETADLDHRADTMIQETIRSKFKNCTVLISANRLQAVIDCDRVMVLDNGQLKEFEEPHLLLLNRLSFFSRLVEKTGTINALQLRKAARKAYEFRHDSENTLDIIPDSVRSFLSSYIPVSGYTDLQLVSYV